ncbi:MAG: ABC-2 family transporter protein [Bdellovibrionales bacterium]
MMVCKLDYLFHLALANIKSHAPEKMRLFIMSLFMILQNFIFFCVWLVLFDVVSDLKGWRLPDVARMYGLTATSIGIAMFLCNGVRTLAFRLQDGTFDMFLSRPRHPLPLLMFSASGPASLGDILYGPLMWIIFTDAGPADLLLLFLLAVNASILFGSMMLVIYSLNFWLRNHAHVSEHLFETSILATSNIVHGQPFWMKLILFTVVPSGFINILPIAFFQNLDPLYLVILLAASLFYAWIAINVFNAGVRRYLRG